ncbi:hypothetical protein [Wolbachia endosymbiont (group A) of Colletes cunicularius]
MKDKSLSLTLAVIFNTIKLIIKVSVEVCRRDAKDVCIEQASAKATQ